MQIIPETFVFDAVAPGFVEPVKIFEGYLNNPRIVGLSIACYFGPVPGVGTVQLFNSQTPFFPRKGVSGVEPVFFFANTRPAFLVPGLNLSNNGVNFIPIDHVLPGPPYYVRVEYRAIIPGLFSIIFLTTRQLQDPWEVAAEETGRMRHAFERVLGDQMVRRYGMALRNAEAEKAGEG